MKEWLSNLIRQPRVRRRPPRPLQALLRLEVLEDRTVPSTLVVTTLADQNSGPGTSLRQALNSANESPTPTTITFAPGLNGTINLSLGQLFLGNPAQPITIVGPGAGLLTIDGNNSSGVFQVGSGVTAEITGLTVAHGNALSGGGLYNFGTLTLAAVHFVGNTATDTAGFTGGGAIYNNGGTLNVIDCQFMNNSSAHDAGAVDSGVQGGQLNIRDSTFTGNTGLFGGALWASTSLSLSGSTFSNNSAQAGGAVFGSTSLSLSSSTFSNNSADQGGGFFVFGGTANVSACTFTGNTASQQGGGYYTGPGSDTTATFVDSAFTGNSTSGDGGGLWNGATNPLTLTGCVIDHNTAANTGGGIANEGGTLAVSDSIFSINSAGFAGGGLRIDGGSVSVASSTILNNTAAFSAGVSNNANGAVTLTNTTITGNSATGTGVVTAGGIANYTNEGQNSTVTLINCTLSNNSASNPQYAGDLASVQEGGGSPSISLVNTILASSLTSGRPNAVTAGGTIVSLGHNLSTDSSGNLSPEVGDLVNTNPLLGPLRGNGGPVPTQLLLPGSPALDAGASGGPSVDARGVSRPQNAAVDIGAVEDRPFSVQLVAAGQSAVVATSYATPVQLRILEGDNPVVGAQVTFTLTPGSASGTFPDGLVEVTTTDANGFATAGVITAGQKTGVFSISAGTAGLPAASGNLIVQPGAVVFLDVSGPASVAPGVPFSLTLTPRDQFGNSNPGYQATLALVTDDPRAAVPATVSIPGGSTSYTISGLVLNTTGPHTLRLTDQAQPSLTSTVAIGVDNAAPTSASLSLDTSPVLLGQPFTLSGTFADAGGLDQAHTVAIDWGDGQSTTLTLPAGVLSFSTGHAYSTGLPAADPANVTIGVTVTDSLGASSSQTIGQKVRNVPPLVDAGGDQFVTQGDTFVRTVQFFDLGGGAFTGSVDYGDGTPAQTLSFGPDRTAMLSHVFADEGSFVVTVQVRDERGGVGVAAFFADVLLPGVQVAAKGAVAAGQSVSVPGATAQVLSTSLPGGAAVILAVVPPSVAAALGAPSATPAAPITMTAFDLRVVGQPDVIQSVLVSFHYTGSATAVPTVTFFDRTTGRQMPVSSQLFRINQATQTITILFDRFSTPSVDDLRRTVFTISVPTELSTSSSSGQTGLLIALVMGTTTTQTAPGEAAVTGQAGVSAPGALPPGALSVVAAALAANTAGTNEAPSSSGAASSESGPLRELPPAPDALITLPSVTIVPSRVPTPPLPPSASLPSEEEPQEPGPAAWLEPGPTEQVSDQVFAEVASHEPEQGRQAALWLAALPVLSACVMPQRRRRRRARMQAWQTTP
jgi:hypothetical protein